MAAFETFMSFLGAGGGAGGIAAIVKSVFDKSDAKKKLVEFETVTLPAIRQQYADAEKRVSDAIGRVVALEQRMDTAVRAAEARVRSVGRQQSVGDGAQAGAAAAELVALRREIETLKGAVDSVRQSMPAAVQRLDSLDERFTRFEAAYHDDYGELTKELANMTGEFRAEMRRRS